jgi:hypothetical protein
MVVKKFQKLKAARREKKKDQKRRGCAKDPGILGDGDGNRAVSTPENRVSVVCSFSGWRSHVNALRAFPMCKCMSSSEADCWHRPTPLPAFRSFWLGALWAHNFRGPERHFRIPAHKITSKPTLVQLCLPESSFPFSFSTHTILHTHACTNNEMCPLGATYNQQLYKKIVRKP